MLKSKYYDKYLKYKLKYQQLKQMYENGEYQYNMNNEENFLSESDNENFKDNKVKVTSRKNEEK